MKTIITRLFIFAMVIFMVNVWTPIYSYGQNIVFNDDFSSSTSSSWTTSGVIGTSAWNISRSGNDWGGRRNTTTAQLGFTNDASVTTNTAGWILATTSMATFNSPFNTILKNNAGIVSWSFNMRQIRNDPAGFGSGSYGVAFILAGTSTTTATTGNGYAVVLGQSGETDPLRFVKYTSGLQGSMTNIITSNTGGLTDFGAEYLSIKVTYNPYNDSWQLFLRNDGSSAFSDPAIGLLISQGSTTDNTYTSTALNLMGAYWQGSTAANQTAFFDNTQVSLSYPDVPTVTATPSSICSGNNAVLAVTAGNLNNADTWQWYTASCGGTLVGSGTSLTVSPTTTTTYYVRGEGVNQLAGSCATLTVTVLQPLSSPLIASVSQPECPLSTASVAFSGLPASGIWTLTESVNSTTISGSGTTASFSSLPAGNTYTFNVRNADGCTSSASAAVKVNSFKLAPITVISNVNIYEGSTYVDIPVTVTDFNNDVAGISLTLHYDAAKLGSPSLQSNPLNLLFNVPIPGTIKIAGIEPSAGQGFSLSGTTLFNLRFTILSPFASSSVTFDDANGIDCEYAGNESEDSFSYLPFCDILTATYYLNGGVNVNPFPQGSLTANGAFCGSGAGQLTWTATSGTGPYTLIYNDGTADRIATAVMSGTAFDVFTTPVTTTTTYTLVSVADANCERTDGFTASSATITVNALPAATITASGPTTFFAGDQVILTSGIASVYAWSNGASTASVTITTTGNYTINVTDANGCQATSAVTVVTVNPAPGGQCDPVVYVTNERDDGSDMTLRNAIASVCEGGTIYFDISIDGRTINLLLGTLVIDKNITFDNCNQNLGITLNGNGNNITINTGKTLSLSGCSKFTVKGPIVNNAGVSGLVLASGASLIYNICDLPATVQRYLRGGWHLFGSPFKQNMGARLLNLMPPSGSAQLRPYTNGVNWQTTVTSAYFSFVPTIGYAVKPSASFTASLTGLLYCGPCDYSIPLVYNGSASTKSWNLLANPFTSYLNWNLLAKTNVNNTLYLWDNASLAPVTNAMYFRTYNAASNVGVPSNTTRYIAPMQGFFVKAVYTNPRITFSQSARTHMASTYYKEASSTEILLRLKAESDMGYDELVICKNVDAKTGFEEFDSEKLFNDAPLACYSQTTTGEMLTINTIDNSHAIIPLGIRGQAGDRAKLTAFAMESGEQLYLEDRYMGKFIALSENTTYNFEFPTDLIQGRFFIHFENPTMALTNSDIKVSENDNQLNIIAQTGEEIQEVEVYTITGSLVFKARSCNTNVFAASLQLRKAMYLVKVKTSLSTQNVKINWN